MGRWTHLIVDLIQIVAAGLCTMAVKKEWWYVYFPLLILIVLSIGCRWFLQEDRVRRKLCLTLLDLRNTMKFDDEIRVCLFVHNGRGSVRQLTPFILTRSYGLRRYPDSKGIVGLAFRTGKAVIWNLKPDRGNFTDQMVRKWGFSQMDLKKIPSDRRSFMCVPIRGLNGTPVAAVYCDSRQEDFFTDELKRAISGSASEILECLQ